MDLAPRAADEGRRLAVLRQYAGAIAPSDTALRELAELAAAVCQAPTAFIALVDEARVWYPAAIGFMPQDTPRDHAIGALLVDRTELLIISDTSADARCAHDPLVGDPARARFVAAAPLVAPGGHVIGCLGVADRAPRTLEDSQAAGLAALSRQVIT